MADPKEQQQQQAKEQLSKDREVREKIVEEVTKKTSTKPTPTQEENDLAKLGQPVEHKQDDGGGPDPHVQREAKPAAGHGTYQTRQQKPAT